MRISKNIRRNFSPLNATCDLVVEGGALHQIFRPDTDEYSPDRAITPLTVRPVIRVVDVDGIFGNGIANARLGDIKWFANKINVSGNSKYVIDTTSTENKGTLKIYQNVAAGSSLTLYFEGIIPDTRNGKSLKVNGSILLNTNIVSKEKVTAEIDKPKVILFDPINTMTKLTIKATVYLADNILAAQNTKIWWYKRINDGTLSLIDPEDDLEYISGINTATLVLDQRYVNKKKDYRVVADFVKTGTVVPAIPSTRAAFLDFSIRRKYPAWEMDVLSFGDLTANQNVISTKALITAGRTIIDNPANYFSIRWYSKNSSGTEKQYGFGSEQEVPADVTGLNTGGIEIGADILEKDSLKALSIGSVVITVNGKLIIV